MRRVLASLLAVLFFAMPVISAIRLMMIREEQDANVAQKIGMPFVWPAEKSLADPKVALSIFRTIVADQQVNILRSSSLRLPSGRNQINAYVMMNKDSTLFHDYSLHSGRWISAQESQNRNIAVSTLSAQALGVDEVVGVPNVVGDRYDLTISSLQYAFTSLNTAGTYILETHDVDKFHNVMKYLLQLSLQYEKSLTIEQFEYKKAPQQETNYGIVIITFVCILGALCALILSIILAVRYGKGIGIMRLLGYSKQKVWWQIIGRNIILFSLISILICTIVLAMLRNVDGPFVFHLYNNMIVSLLFCIIAAYCTSMLIISRIKISDLIKGYL